MTRLLLSNSNPMSHIQYWPDCKLFHSWLATTYTPPFNKLCSVLRYYESHSFVNTYYIDNSSYTHHLYHIIYYTNLTYPTYITYMSRSKYYRVTLLLVSVLRYYESHSFVNTYYIYNSSYTHHLYHIIYYTNLTYPTYITYMTRSKYYTVTLLLVLHTDFTPLCQ